MGLSRLVVGVLSQDDAAHGLRRRQAQGGEQVRLGRVHGRVTGLIGGVYLGEEVFAPGLFQHGGQQGRPCAELFVQLHLIFSFLFCKCCVMILPRGEGFGKAIP